jgi:hypothetical protein
MRTCGSECYAAMAGAVNVAVQDGISKFIINNSGATLAKMPKKTSSPFAIHAIRLCTAGHIGNK